MQDILISAALAITIYAQGFGFAAGEYLIVYRIDGEDVVILRVLGGSRDLPSVLRDL